MPGGDFSAFLTALRQRYPVLPERLSLRLARAYGTRVERVLGGARSLADLGRDLGAGLSEREVDYLVAEEFAREPEDIVWRRSKLGLHGGAALADALAIHLAKLQSGEQTGAAPAQAQGGRG